MTVVGFAAQTLGQHRGLDTQVHANTSASCNAAAACGSRGAAAAAAITAGVGLCSDATSDLCLAAVQSVRAFD